MVTGRAVPSTRRSRRRAGPLRVLWLAALLFALLYTHAAGADSASAHVTGGATTVPHAASVEIAGTHHPGDEGPSGTDGDTGHSHSAEACASGHPEHGCDLPCPHLIPLEELTSAFAAMRPQLWAPTLPSGLPPWRSSLGSVVQQV
ncbi:hypothetical protein ACFVFI_17910 [Streptomyces sp. NPDC057705]|uniref:hypothetical protein n=1 Tax=Streptomyces sp. NPDC057705 TaxID=3346222 RepID=UPI0036958824